MCASPVAWVDSGRPSLKQHRGRSDDLKDTLRRTIVQNLGRQPGIAAADIMILIYETAMRNWSFAGGEPRRE